MAAPLTDSALATLFALAFLASLALAEGLRRGLLFLNRVDPPRSDRWHRRPVPRPGGPALFLTIAAGIALVADRPWSRDVWGLLAGTTFMFLTGLADDLVTLPNPLKLTLLVTGAVIPALFGITHAALPPALGVPVGILWVVVVTNAVNWLDNMDGLAAGTSVLVAGALFLVSMDPAQSLVSATAVLIAASCLGFLVLNFHPAKIFMGDSGSATLGFLLATLALLRGQGHIRNVLLTLVVPLMILSVPLFDTALVLLTRLAGGRRLFQGGSDHPSHRLVVLGLSERRAVVFLYVLSALSGIVALYSSSLGTWYGLALAGAVLVVFVAIGLTLARVRVYEGVPPAEIVGVVLRRIAGHPVALQIVIDVLLVCAAYVGAALLRFDGVIPESYETLVGRSLPIVVGVKIIFLYAFGLYRNDWRYTTWLDLVALTKALVLGSVALVVVLFMWNRLLGFSRAAFVIDGLLAFLLLGGYRVSAPALREYFMAQRTGGRRVLIVGSGWTGVLLLEELQNNPDLRYRPVGFVDDDPAKRGAVVRGVEVLGSSVDLPALVRTHGVDEILITRESLSLEQIRRIARRCREARVPYRFTRSLLGPAG